MINKIEKLPNNKIMFTYISDDSEFKNKDGEVIGISSYSQQITLDSKEKALAHLEGELDMVEKQLDPLLKRKQTTHFDHEKFGKISEVLITNKGQATVAKYKELDKMLKTYDAIKRLDEQIKMFHDNKSKIQDQINKIKEVK